MGPKDSFYAGLIAFVLPNVPDKIQFAVRDERLHGLPDATFARVHLSDQSIPFELRLDKAGVLQVSVAGKPGSRRWDKRASVNGEFCLPTAEARLPGAVENAINVPIDALAGNAKPGEAFPLSERGLFRHASSMTTFVGSPLVISLTLLSNAA